MIYFDCSPWGRFWRNRKVHDEKADKKFFHTIKKVPDAFIWFRCSFVDPYAHLLYLALSSDRFGEFEFADVDSQFTIARKAKVNNHEGVTYMDDAPIPIRLSTLYRFMHGSRHNPTREDLAPLQQAFGQLKACHVHLENEREVRDEDYWDKSENKHLRDESEKFEVTRLASFKGVNIVHQKMGFLAISDYSLDMLAVSIYRGYFVALDDGLVQLPKGMNMANLNLLLHLEIMDHIATRIHMAGQGRGKGISGKVDIGALIERVRKQDTKGNAAIKRKAQVRARGYNDRQRMVDRIAALFEHHRAHDSIKAFDIKGGTVHYSVETKREQCERIARLSLPGSGAVTPQETSQT